MSSPEKCDEKGSSTCKGESAAPATAAEYECVNNIYYYTDKSSGKRFMFSEEKKDWVEAPSAADSVTVDKDGRQYYYADGLYLCRDTSNNVFYMSDTKEWKPWETKSAESGTSHERWYFYQGSDTFYRDNSTDKVYRLNPSNNEWQIYEGKLKGRKRKKCDEEEEFDSDEEISEDEEEEDVDYSRPPGYQNDPYISYDGTMYLKLDPRDGVTYEWVVARKAWFPKLNDDFLATYQLSYGFNPDGTKNENPLKFDDDEEEKADIIPEKEKPKVIEKKKASWFDVEDAHNTKVYVSGLPEDTTEEEFVDFMQKCGLVLKEIDTQKFKIKMYKNKDGRFKGDALCTYIRKESVDLALQILDGSYLKGQCVKVEMAKFTLKGDYDPSLKPKKKRKKELEKLQKKQEKLLDWRPEPMRGQRAKHEMSVILRNAFSPQEFEDDATKLLTHQETLRAQCESFGAVKKIELFDRHPEGVVKVTFEEAEGADLCAATLNNRLYGKRRLASATWDGKESFKVEETEEEKKKRIEKWGEYLEGGGGGEEKTKKKQG